MQSKKFQDRPTTSTKKKRFHNAFIFLVKGNIYIFAMFALLLLNKNEWRYDGVNHVENFLFVFESFFILLMILVIIKPRDQRFFLPNAPIIKHLYGFLIALSVIAILSLIILPAGLPFPSTIVFFVLATNLLIALYSIVFHKVAIVLFVANTERSKEKVLDYVFMYIVILLTGINHFVQSTLIKQPLLINKLFALLFILILFIQIINTGTTFTY